MEEEVGQIDTLLSGFLSAQTESGQVAASVSEAADRLAGHVGKAASLEADFRIMGLNMTFRCSRLGVAGRPLSIIAQELRLYAKQIAAEAEDVMIDLDRLMAIARQLSDGPHDGGAADIAAASGIMENSLSRLAAAGQRLANAWDALGHDGHCAVSLLQETVARTRAQDGIGRVLRQAAAELAAFAPNAGYDLDNAPPQANRLFELITRSYTMEAERMVLMRHAPGSRHWKHAAASTPSASAEATIEDSFL